MNILISTKTSVIISAQPSVRRSNIPLLPRVASNVIDPAIPTSSLPPNRPPSAGDALRKISYTRKFNRSNSEKLNVNATPPSSSQNSPSVS
jgi:hypothetical protein